MNIAIRVSCANTDNPNITYAEFRMIPQKLEYFKQMLIHTSHVNEHMSGIARYDTVTIGDIELMEHIKSRGSPDGVFGFLNAHYFFEEEKTMSNTRWFSDVEFVDGILKSDVDKLFDIFPLSCSAREQIYQETELDKLKLDAEKYAKDLINQCDEKFRQHLQTKLNELKDADYKCLAKRFRAGRTDSTTNKDLWAYTINKYINETPETS